MAHVEFVSTTMEEVKGTTVSLTWLNNIIAPSTNKLRDEGDDSTMPIGRGTTLHTKNQEISRFFQEIKEFLGIISCKF
jgi:hypothetical protein